MLAQQNEWPHGWGGVAAGAGLILAALFCWVCAAAFGDAAKSRPAPPTWLRVLGWDHRWRQWNSVACAVGFGAMGIWAALKGAYEVSPWLPAVAVPLSVSTAVLARVTRPTREARRLEGEAKAAEAMREERRVYERLEAVRRDRGDTPRA